jgi:hypothetical protein
LKEAWGFKKNKWRICMQIFSSLSKYLTVARAIERPHLTPDLRPVVQRSVFPHSAAPRSNESQDPMKAMQQNYEKTLLESAAALNRAQANLVREKKRADLLAKRVDELTKMLESSPLSEEFKPCSSLPCECFR